MKAIIWIALAATAAAAGAVPSLAAAPALQEVPAARNWTKTVVKTPQGGFRMGNPDAPVKLVEYGSLTCDHCANFAHEAMPALRNQVRSGKLSFEFRNFVLNPFDISASLLSRCAPPESFFGLIDTIFHTQAQWVGRFQALTPAQRAEIQALPQNQQMTKVAAFGGLDALAARHGVSPEKGKACLSDPAGVAQLLELRQSAVDKHQVAGTPTFIVNGVKVDAHDWGALEPLLKPAGG